MAGVFAASVFASSVYATGTTTTTTSTGPASGRGLGGAGRKRRYGDDLTYEQWQAIAELRDRLADEELAKRAPKKLLQAVKRTVAPIVEKVAVEPDAWTPPKLDATVAELVAGLDALLAAMAAIDAMTERARAAWQEEQDDDEAAAIFLLLH